MSAIHLTSKNFESEAVRADTPVLIDFFAAWCGPCKMLSPIIEKIAAEHPEIKVCKVDIDEEPSLAERFGVMSVPTLAVMKNGEVVRTSAGFRPETAVLALLQD